ncbi:Rrf2 family transcriptional regulator [Paenibacillus sepulcri]|uniref:Rrf2 family transcriptional regulator n=1 Tax=Paenibacillus sepulcri TaxID=359917 RepID=A0ABS7CAQ5_9BACL|nr:Rrf2 family transcriptional regulator [Paenibacillus sepulcri]
MAISSRLAVAVHILVLIETHEGKRITSDYIASSVNTNPVVVRRLMGVLNKAGIIATTPGIPGATLLRPAKDISLADVYCAVEHSSQEGLFSLHENPNPNCPVGNNIEHALEDTFGRAQIALESELAAVTIADIASECAKMSMNQQQP